MKWDDIIDGMLFDLKCKCGMVSTVWENIGLIFKSCLVCVGPRHSASPW